MFWWEKAALSTRAGKVQRFGFITTNSLRQTFNRKVLEPHLADPKTPLSLLFAIPDHPWVDAGDGAAVRIAMTVAASGLLLGRLVTVKNEGRRETDGEGRSVSLSVEKGRIFANLRIGADVAGAGSLSANSDLAYQGVTPLGEGFRVSRVAAEAQPDAISAGVLKRYLNGKQFIAGERPAYIIDLYGLSEGEARSRFPVLYQQVLDTVRPKRLEQKRDTYREGWWLFAEPRSKMRESVHGLGRIIATCRTATHRVFGFLDAAILPDAKLIAICLEDAWALAVLSSRIHVTWAVAAGAWLGVGNDANYNHAQCFNPFPFPETTDVQKTRLRSLGEDVDAHRKARQAEYPKLTLTGMYNVLEKLRAGERIEGRDREVYDQGLIGILRDLHDQIDAAVADAYGWPATLTDDDILHRLVTLNRERAAEEARGHIRWLRPEYQNPAGHAAATTEQAEMDVGVVLPAAKTPWPKTLPQQFAAVRAALDELGEATPEQIARHFARARATTVLPLLESLAALGHAQVTERGSYAA